ncbi:hypothetical protein TURU_029059 [Turdus rufiventris]|nr:hypothetical protein TURU_029059 [Turdus rufiventris]
MLLSTIGELSPPQFGICFAKIRAGYCAEVKAHGVDENHKIHQILSKDAALSTSCLEKWDTASGITGVPKVLDLPV